MEEEGGGVNSITHICISLCVYINIMTLANKHYFLSYSTYSIYRSFYIYKNVNLFYAMSDGLWLSAIKSHN